MLQTSTMLRFLMLALVVTSCIKPFEPNIKSSDAHKYVVSGQVTNVDELQTVNVSRTSSINDPQYIPVTGCVVQIIDDKGNKFDMADMYDGNYTTTIDAILMASGSSFMVEVNTPDGEKLVSEFDQISTSPPVDSVYFIRKDIEGNIPGQFTLGIQFYLNFKGSASDSRYYRWNIIETWEYHADYPLEWWYDGTIHHEIPPDYSRSVCWRTIKIPQIFTLTTTNLSENEFDQLQLQYVDNMSSRLAYGYSMLVEQIALSEAAYNYWDQLLINSGQEGGLYERQPLAIRGNMTNLSNPDDIVLGFFNAASVTSKRIFVNVIPDLPLDFSTYCSPSTLRKGLKEFTPGDYPAYLMGDAVNWFPVWLNHECVNCLMLGGINVKPDFWPY